MCSRGCYKASSALLIISLIRILNSWNAEMAISVLIVNPAIMMVAIFIVPPIYCLSVLERPIYS
jgi:hypothetical protein